MVIIGWLGWFGLFVVPTPHSTRADGVIWVPQHAQLRAGADGFVQRVAANPGQIVPRDTALIYMEDPSLELQIHVLEAQLRLLRARAQSDRQTDLVTWALTNEEIKATQAELDDARKRVSELVVDSPTSGEFVPAIPIEDIVSEMFSRGKTLANPSPPEQEHRDAS